MKLSIKVSELAKALKAVANGVSNSLPILGCVKIAANLAQGCVDLDTTNLDLFIGYTVRNVKIESAGTTVVLLKPLLNIIQSLPQNHDVILSLEGKSLHIKSIGHDFDLPNIDSTDFPEFPIDGEMVTNLTCTDCPRLTTDMNKVIFAASKDFTRPALTGMYLSFGESLTLCSTDGYRLTEFKGYNDEVKATCIVPSLTVKIVDKLFRDTEETMTVKLYQDKISFATPTITVASKLVDGHFPEYKQLIPKEFKTSLLLDYRRLLEAIKLASCIDPSAIELEVANNTVTVRTAKTEEGSGISVIDCEATGEAKVRVNPTFMLDFLSAISGEEVEIKIADSGRPVQFTIPNIPEITHIIMPLL